MRINQIGAAFGVRLLGAALVVLSGTTDFRDEGPDRTPSPTIAAESKATTKAAPSSRTPNDQYGNGSPGLAMRIR